MNKGQPMGCLNPSLLASPDTISGQSGPPDENSVLGEDVESLDNNSTVHLIRFEGGINTELIIKIFPDPGQEKFTDISITNSNGETVMIVDKVIELIYNMYDKQSECPNFIIKVITDNKSSWEDDYLDPSETDQGFIFIVYAYKLNSIQGILAFLHELGHVIAYVTQKEEYLELVLDEFRILQGFTNGEHTKGRDPGSDDNIETLKDFIERNIEIGEEVDAWSAALELARILGLDKFSDQEAFRDFMLWAIGTRVTPEFEKMYKTLQENLGI